MFGRTVPHRIDPEWHSHASIPRTVMDLLELPPMGVPRVDDAPSLAPLLDAALNRSAPPEPGAVIGQPAPPHPTPAPVPPKPWPGKLGVPMPALVTLDGSVLPAPGDGVVHPNPPKPPRI